MEGGGEGVLTGLGEGGHRLLRRFVGGLAGCDVAICVDDGLGRSFSFAGLQEGRAENTCVKSLPVGERPEERARGIMVVRAWEVKASVFFCEPGFER